MDATRVTASEFQQSFGALSDKARREPVIITRHGRDSLVVVAVEEWQRLMRRDRKAFATGELPDHLVEAIAAADMDPRHEPLNELLGDWKP